jgi:hypothetical protein
MAKLQCSQRVMALDYRLHEHNLKCRKPATNLIVRKDTGEKLLLCSTHVEALRKMFPNGNGPTIHDIADIEKDAP